MATLFLQFPSFIILFRTSILRARWATTILAPLSPTLKKKKNFILNFPAPAPTASPPMSLILIDRNRFALSGVWSLCFYINFCLFAFFLAPFALCTTCISTAFPSLVHLCYFFLSCTYFSYDRV